MADGVQGVVLVGDDSKGIESLDGVLRDRFGWELSRVSLDAWRTRKPRQNCPQLLFLDLRGGEDSPLWDELAQLPCRLGDSERDGPRIIGLLDGGYSLSRAAMADALLTGAISWPCSGDELAVEIRAALERRAASSLPESCELAGESKVFRTYTEELFSPLQRLAMAAAHDFTILLVGETGTGKTTLAQIIHELSPRSAEKFLPVGCGALPSDLIDSELFGHVRGAFTGAERDKQGKFEAAGSGTLLLDEIDVLGLIPQAKLLRVLESGEFERVGANETRVAGCRTIVAANVKLEALIEERRFRSDLYFRLNQVKFEIPPLRERQLDIAPLAVEFIQECGESTGRPIQRVHPLVLRVLKDYPWPGNIRELRNEMRQAALYAEDGTVTPNLLNPEILRAAEQAVRRPASDSRLAGDVAVTERESIERMLRKQEYNRAATARALGISRVTLYNKIRKYNIDLDDPR